MWSKLLNEGSEVASRAWIIQPIEYIVKEEQ
jgi:hypothetical protein